MTFKEYLATLDASSADDPMQEDFISDAQSDRKMPDVATLAELTAYMTYQRRACSEAVNAAENIWKDYEVAKYVESRRKR